MAYIVPIHQPSSVRHAIKLRFLEPEDEALVVGKANRLEIYKQTTEGLSLVHSRTVYGYITMLERLRPPSSQTDHLFVGTDRYQYFIVSWDPARMQLRTEQSYVDQADKVLRDSREADRCHVDPTRRFLSLELYEGVVTVVPIPQKPRKVSTGRQSSAPTSPDIASLGEPVQVRIEELLIRSSGFVQTPPDSKSKPQIALLWADNHDVPHLKIRELAFMPGAPGEVGSADLKTIAELRDELDLGVSHLVPVSHPYGGFLLLGERSIGYVPSDLSNMISEPLGKDDEATIWTSWEKIDDHRWLLADDYGRLFFLMILISQGQVESWRLDLIGTASKASTLVYLDEGFVYVGSHTGDSQIIKILERGMEVVQTFPNIAPILDFTIMDLGRGADGGQTSEFSSGQARIVTASGAWQDGSIRSVRSGVGIEELGSIGELSHIIDMWGLSSSGLSYVQDLLLVSLYDETRVFKLDAEASVEEIDSFYELDLSRATLLAANLPNRRLLHIHEGGAKYVDLESGMELVGFKPPNKSDKVTGAAANSEHAVIVTGGRRVLVIALCDPTGSVAVHEFPEDAQIASVTLPPAPTGVFLVAFWQSALICVLDLFTFEPKYTQLLGSPGIAIPRSLTMANVLSTTSSTLFIAMADGSVITFAFDSKKNLLHGMNQIILGSEPVFFKLLPQGSESGLSSVFASCEQPSLIYASEGRIVYSAVSFDKASRVCHFNSEAYPAAIALATPDELKLAMIETERTTQLQTGAIGETVRCIAYSPSHRIFGMGCIRRSLEGSEERLYSSFKIADEITFRELDTFQFNQRRELVECVVDSGPIQDTDTEKTYNMFVVGTSVLKGDFEVEPGVKGRIIILGVGKDGKLKELYQESMKTSVRSLAMCDGKLVAGLVKTVVLYSIKTDSPGGDCHYVSLVKLTGYRVSTSPLSLSITPSTPDSPATIAVADLMKSVSILSVLPPEPGAPRYRDKEELEESARHFSTLWSSAVAAVGTNEWLVADMEGNLVVLRRNVGGVTDDDRRRLEVVSEGRLGEVVNQIVPVSLSSSPGRGESLSTLKSDTDTLEATKLSGPAVSPRAFIATVEGGVYLMGAISPGYQDMLIRLQSALAARVQSPGYMPWANWRAFKTEVRQAEEPYRFVDGELVECALGIDDGVFNEIIQELNVGGTAKGRRWDAEEVRGLVEGLRRLH